MMIVEAVQDGRGRLEKAGVTSARLDADLLMAETLGVGRAYVMAHAEQELTKQEAGAYRAILARREQREPLSHITGTREFWSLPFRVSNQVLDPRPDSETLVEAVLDSLEGREGRLRILDLGTGSGCLLLSLLNELPNASGTGVDISEAALAIARENAAMLGLESRTAFVQSDWTAEVKGRFDLIVSNPPYIPTAELADLMPEVRDHEPFQALWGGPDGMASYRRLAGSLPQFLKQGGAVFLEIGRGQEATVQSIFSQAGWQPSGEYTDLAGIVRSLAFTC